MNKVGGCICGAVRYELLGDPLFIHVCHCTECQHDSGGAFQVTAQAHIWIKEKQSWFAIPDNVPSFQKEYDYTQLWPKASLERVNGT